MPPSELDSAIASFRRQRLDYDLAEAELARSQAALAAGELAAASRWAAAAERRFRRRGNDAGACVAKLARLRARSISPGRPAPIAAEALRLAAAAARPQAGQRRGPGRADRGPCAARGRASQRGETADRGGAPPRAGGVAGRHPAAAAGPGRAGRAGRAAGVGAGRAAGGPGDGACPPRPARQHRPADRSGRPRRGSGRGGLRLALDRRSAPLVFAWLERSRAQAFRVRPVRPPADPEAAAILAELRQLSYLIRNAELDGVRDPAADHQARRAAARDPGAQLARPAAWVRPTAQASLGEVSAGLEQSGQSLVAIVARHGRMLAVIVRRGSAHLVELGDFEEAAEAARRLNADLDTLAGRRLPARLETVLRESIRHQTEVLTAEIVAPLLSSLGDDGVVFVPAGALASIPWNMLPGLRDRPVTVCPSASSWLAAWRRGQTEADGARASPPLLAAGPDLLHAADEVTEIAKVYPGCRLLLGGNGHRERHLARPRRNPARSSGRARAPRS